MYMLFRKHKGGRTFYAEGFTTYSEARSVKAKFEEKDAQFPTGRPKETIIERVGDGIKGQLEAAIQGPSYRTELTEAGEQTVIPGCEADNPQGGKRQMDLF